MSAEEGGAVFTEHEQHHEPPHSSKRKRITSQREYTARITGPDAVLDEHIPKRSRSTRYRTQDGDDSSDGSEDRGRNVRRVNGTYGLSSMSKRQAPESITERPSKFQEGSMNDKPSAKPPSVFIRSLSNENLGPMDAGVDTLMDAYHESTAAHEDELYGMVISADKELPPIPVASGKESGLYRFGRMFATSKFNPYNLVNAWSRTWKEAEEDLTIENIERNRRKAAQKEEAERRYAELKKAGQLGQGSKVYTVVHRPDAEPNADQLRDNAEQTDEQLEIEADAGMFSPSQLLPPPQVAQIDHSLTTAAEESQDKTVKQRKSVFHIRKPSLPNLKRASSIYNLASHSRQSSSSLSPDKQAAVGAPLKKSQSKKDLHRQQKLNKKVSDLESQLQRVRQELADAINNASPMPELPTRFQKYTPNGKSISVRSKFVPGKLPTLPSERLLNPGQLDLNEDEDADVQEFAAGRTQTQRTPSLSKGSFRQRFSFLPTFTGNEKQPSAEKSQYPPRTSSRQASLSNSLAIIRPEVPVIDYPEDPVDVVAEMEPNTVSAETNASVADTAQIPSYEDLDAKLTTIDAGNTRASAPTKKLTKCKKRKSGGNDDAPYRPGKDSDGFSDDEFDQTTPKKKRKSTGKSHDSPEIRKLKKAESKTANKLKKIQQADHQEDDNTPAERTSGEHSASDSVIDYLKPNTDQDLPPARTSIDSQAPSLSLEPIYEEDTIIVANEDNGLLEPPAPHVTYRSRSRSPSKYPTIRDRSASPHKSHRTVSQTRKVVSVEIEKTVKGNRKSRSPPPKEGLSKAATVVDEAVRVRPGVGSVPDMPTGPAAERRRQVTDQEFEWPEDVF